jgi:hypothetical protein
MLPTTSILFWTDFLKYVSDAFDERQSELKDLFAQADDHNIYYMPRDQYDTKKNTNKQSLMN